MKLEFVDNLRLVVKGFRRKRRAVLLRQPASSPDAEADNAVPRRFDVSVSISELVKMVKGETLDEATMGIALKHIRSTALPGYVFPANTISEAPANARSNPLEERPGHIDQGSLTDRKLSLSSASVQ
ncbi:hypothetical protein C8F04DRAFT_1264092 [Mycena alexandri]|uniref:Uncharacterized protein n=1 Tax=Mycena alexandri TaxID=1745969 RepID=A0AAD6WYU6_9AGAR|nr:hypothetical protein C8F04DRAFT_1264092 [Mycena alexandri]